jgi:hypothetical protein
MIDWRRGGWTGSLNRWVRREVREQLRDNVAARRARYGLAHRAFRRFFSIGRFVALYLIIDIAIVAAEALTAWHVPGWLSLPSPAARCVEGHRRQRCKSVLILSLGLAQGALLLRIVPTPTFLSDFF